MRLAVHLGLFLASVLMAAAQVPLSRVERASMFGAEYVRLDDWARANGGQFRWVVAKHEAKAVTPAGTLHVTVDSRKVMLKGLHVWVSAPVVLRGNSIYVAVADFTGTIHPLLFPPRFPATTRPLKTIVLDAGHGGKDPGNQEGKRQEKQYTLLLAKDVRDLLAKAGYKVQLTRSSDSYLSPEERPGLAKKRGADLFVSLHFNSADGAGGASVNGCEVYCLTPANAYSTNDRGEQGHKGAQAGNRNDTKNLLLAYQLQRAIAEKTGAEDRGVKRARFAVLKFAEMPAVLIEAAFMTNAGDAKKIYDATLRRTLAQSIVDGIKAYQKLVER
jgi:N-acetylmuramoyl-L-alanine amidase